MIKCHYSFLVGLLKMDFKALWIGQHAVYASSYLNSVTMQLLCATFMQIIVIPHRYNLNSRHNFIWFEEICSCLRNCHNATSLHLIVREEMETLKYSTINLPIVVFHKARTHPPLHKQGGRRGSKNLQAKLLSLNLRLLDNLR
jgi:hypothetical protein